MARLALIFPKQLERETVNIYWSALRIYDIDQVENAMTYIANTQTDNFFPSPGLIVDTIKTHYPHQEVKLLPEPQATPEQTERSKIQSAYAIECVRLGKEWDQVEFQKIVDGVQAGKVRIERYSPSQKERLFANALGECTRIVRSA